MIVAPGDVQGLETYESFRKGLVWPVEGSSPVLCAGTLPAWFTALSLSTWCRAWYLADDQ